MAFARISYIVFYYNRRDIANVFTPYRLSIFACS